jgi:signal transduction histidine kinase
LLTKTKKPFLTDTIKKLTGINILIFFLLLLLFNALLILFVHYITHRNLDQRIGHEIENIVRTLSISTNEISIKDSSEFKEPDLFELTENPYFLQLIDPNGFIILNSRNVNLYGPIPINKELLGNHLVFESFNFNNKSFRSGYYALSDPDGSRVATLQLSVYEKDFIEVMNELLYFNLWAILLFLLLVIVVSVVAAKKTFKPVNEIINNAQSFNVQNLNKRIEVKAKPYDEIGRLRDTLNGLFERIEDYVLEITNFSDHVSHQLMNPLTAIRTEIEYLLKKDRPSEEYKEALAKLSDQTDSMISIIKTLLVIAKSGRTKTEAKTIFNLSKLIKNDVYNSFKNQNIIYEVEDNLYLRGESEKFLMVMQNLIHNSLKYSLQSGDVKVTARKSDGKINILVEDKGIGIDDFEKSSVFQKFYRSNQAEKLGIKGYGLGLSLVKSIIDEAAGTIEIIDNKPSGTILKITLQSVELG